MNSTEEKTVNTIELDAKAKELIERIRQMNKEKFEEESNMQEIILSLGSRRD